MDVSTAFIRDMQTLGYRGSLSQYTAFRIHGVNAAFVRGDMRDFGLKDLSVDQLVAMRIHGVSTQFIRAEGRGLSERAGGEADRDADARH